MAEDIPEQLGRYAILRRLGAGGMAEVFLAKSTGAEGIEKVLVVKRVLPTFARSAKFIAMFLEEAKIATRLNHPNIVQVYAFEQVKGEFLLAMEFVDGLDLGRLVSAARRKGKRIPYSVAAFLAMEIAKGLDYAHKRKDERGELMEIVHRDVSPQNVLLSYEGVVKVADFGIAKARMVTEETGVIKGKFSYMSPEQARGERVDARSDVYSLGVLLAELLMNRPMYPGQHGLDVLDQVRQGKVTPPRRVDPNVPRELADLVERAMAYDREERFASTRDFATALNQYLHRSHELVDSSTLEQLITELVPREVTSPDAVARNTNNTAATVASGVLPSNELRERRHVVVLSGRVHGGDDGETNTASVGDEAARVLADIAYKADAVLSWPEGTGRNRFRFILGLRRASVHDPLRAMTLALDVVEALHGLSADLDVPLTASLGVSRGVVSTLRDAGGRLVRYEPIGAVLDVAERLAEEGGGGEILVAGEVYRLVRRVFAFDHEHDRDIEVETAEGSTGSTPKGLRAYRLRGARTREERAADARGSAPGKKLIGRDEELRAFAEAYQEAVTARRSVFLALSGELGVGKTALVANAIETLSPRPRVLHVECAFGTSDVPFTAVGELVKDALELGEDISPDAIRARIDQSTDELFEDPSHRAVVGEGLRMLLTPNVDREIDPAERPRSIHRAIRLLLGALAGRAPLLVWVDALQWADGASLEMTAKLIAEADELPLMAVFTSREDPRSERVLAGVPHIEVEELSNTERRDLVRARFDAQVSADVENAIVERAGGNPFFIIELVEALVDRGVVTVEGEGEARRVVRKPGVPIALPTTLEGVIAARLDELPDVERRTIRWLAAAGAGLDAEALGTVMGVDVRDALISLESRGLVSRLDSGECAFPNAVIRHVAYETTDEADRKGMHEQIGRWLATQPVPPAPARIARHLERAGDLAAAADAYLQAAARARAVYSNRDALRFYGRALALLPKDAPGRFYAHEAREQILRGMGKPHEQLSELEAMRAFADRGDDPTLRAMAYNRLARHALDQSRITGVDRLLERALESAIEGSDAGAEVEALRLSALLAREKGDAQAALDHCERALARAGLERTMLAARGSVLVQKATVLRRLGRIEEALAANAEAIVIFHRLNIKRNESQALNALGVALASLGEFEDSARVIRASIALDREIGDRMHLGRKLSNVGQLNAELGQADTALEFLKRADEVMEVVRDDSGRADALAALAELELEVGKNLDRAAECLDQARRLAERTGDRYDLARERIVRTALEMAGGRFEQAEQAAREAVRIAESAGVFVYQLLAQAMLAEALARLGRSEDARATADEVREHLRHRGVVERGERIHFALAKTFESIGDKAAFARELAEAYRVVENRLTQIRSPSIRERYLRAPIVEAIRSAI